MQSMLDWFGFYFGISFGCFAKLGLLYWTFSYSSVGCCVIGTMKKPDERLIKGILGLFVFSFEVLSEKANCYCSCLRIPDLLIDSWWSLKLLSFGSFCRPGLLKYYSALLRRRLPLMTCLDSFFWQRTDGHISCLAAFASFFPSHTLLIMADGIHGLSYRWSNRAVCVINRPGVTITT